MRARDLVGACVISTLAGLGLGLLAGREFGEYFARPTTAREVNDKNGDGLDDLLIARRDGSRELLYGSVNDRRAFVQLSELRRQYEP